MQRIPLRRINGSVYVEGDNGLLIHKPTQSLHALDPMGMLCLLALDESNPESDALEKLINITGKKASALKDPLSQVSQLLHQKDEENSYKQGIYPELKLPVSEPSAQTNSLFVKVAGNEFVISSQCPLIIKALSKLFEPIRYRRSSPTVHLQILKYNQNYTVSVNNLSVEEELSYSQVMPAIIDRLQILAFQRSDFLCCFHGAALNTRKGNLILPGESGAGKSTLCATLAYEGNGVYSDEMVIFDQYFNLLTLELPIAIKSGSWGFLEKCYPELASADVWDRVDGRQLKYVWPKRFHHSERSNLSTIQETRIVCPTYDHKLNNASVQNQPLSVIETLKIMTASGYQLGFELAEPQIEKLLAYLQGAHRSRCVYDNAFSASEFINSKW